MDGTEALDYWSFLTDFGDSAVLLPLVLLIAVYLVFRRRPDLAKAVVLTSGGCGLAMLVLKLALLSCAQPVPRPMIVSPSGHSAMSAVVYGTIAVLMTAQKPVWQRNAILAATILLVGIIGLSRIMVGAHVPAEVIVGLAIGALFAVGFWILSRHRPSDGRGFKRLFLICALSVAVTHGVNPPIEDVIRALAQSLHQRIAVCD